MEKSRTLTEWSADDVITRQLGNTPTPHEMSVTGRVWSVNVQYGDGSSAWWSSLTNLHAKRVSNESKMNEVA
jgi:hypothetical protein